MLLGEFGQEGQRSDLDGRESFRWAIGRISGFSLSTSYQFIGGRKKYNNENAARS